MELLILFLVLVCTAAASFGVALPLALGIKFGMAIGGLTLTKVVDLAIIFADWTRIRFRSFQRALVTAWHFARRVRRASQQFIRTVMRPLDRLLDPYPRSQWCARLVGRWALRGSIILSPLGMYVGWYVYLDRSDVPDIQIVMDWKPPIIGNIRDRNGVVVMRAAYEFRTMIPVSEFSRNRYRVIKDALVAAEDKTFWRHGGVDWPATVKEGSKSAFELSKRGASSITQQVARNLWPQLQEMVAQQRRDMLIVDNFATRMAALVKGTTWVNKSSRKGREIKYAVRIEHQLAAHLGSHKTAKNFILATYANFVNLGDGAYGVEYGAQRYFCKDADQLEPHEAALLASFIPGPNIFNQTRTAKQQTAARVRRNHVLRRMYQIGSITWDEFKHYRDLPLGICDRPHGLKTEAPAAVSESIKVVQAQGYSEHDLHNGDIQVKLTLDLELQRHLKQAVDDSIRGPEPDSFAKRYPGAPLPQAAVVVLRNSDSAILAMFGGFDSGALYNYRDFNRAADALRQPGSTFKIVDIIAAVSVGFGPESPVSAAAISVCDQYDWYGNCIARKSIRNYTSKPLVPSILQEASAQSVNTAFMRLMRDQVGSTAAANDARNAYISKTGKQVTPGAAIADHWARQLGITSYEGRHPTISIVLGSQDVTVLDMANVMRTVCTGIKAQPYVVHSITDRSGSDVFTADIKRSRLPLSADKLALGKQILRGNVKTPRGTARGIMDSARFPIETRGKTGTSSKHRDAWFCGCTDGVEDNAISIAAWVGYDNFGKSLPYLNLPDTKKAAGGRVALPIVRRFLTAVYGKGKLLGESPAMPDEGEKALDEYNAKYHGGAVK